VEEKGGEGKGEKIRGAPPKKNLIALFH